MKKNNWPFYIVTAVFLVLILFPFFWILVTSFKPSADIFGDNAFRVFSRTPTLQNYTSVLKGKNILSSVKNSLIVSSITTLYVIVVSTLAAYAISRFRFRFKNLLMGLILVISMFPQMIVVGPVFNLFTALHWTNSYFIVLPYSTITIPMAVWIMVAHFGNIPLSIEESAKIDGASPARILWSIVFPLAAPGVFTTAIITFIAAWNEYLLTATLNTEIPMQTVPVAISFLRTQFQILWGEVSAATVVVTIPTIIIVLIFQKRIVSGLVSGAVKE
ncbi:MAG TPA: sugar ABC transporter permease [Ruminococcaceae bacterium]|jgi:multiple sugar transport system permease protein|nr:sugar ABC transporter permease [Oscillospiraceae bacterium]HBG54839.1 sugar ABC transporter permease [Oscillospiraceae bacterium]HBQ46082.1 sugar ABC transporter permease [Oscillospiraceae bacterium]HCB90744.1 sugar ABC transporter permease [Oscillospiraceae bacterium]